MDYVRPMRDDETDGRLWNSSSSTRTFYFNQPSSCLLMIKRYKLNLFILGDRKEDGKRGSSVIQIRRQKAICYIVVFAIIFFDHKGNNQRLTDFPGLDLAFTTRRTTQKEQRSRKVVQKSLLLLL